MRSTIRCHLLLACVIPCIACAAMGFTSSEKALVKQASFDHDCPPENIKVLDSMEGGTGQASFKLDVCGTERRYERMGSAYYEKGNEPESVKAVQPK